MAAPNYSVSDRSMAGLKGAVTRQLNNAEKSASSQNPNILSLEADINLLIERWSKFEAKFSEYLNEREGDLNDSEYNELNSNFADFENNYNEQLRNYRSILVNLTGQSVPNNNNHHHNIKVKMPELKLVEFDGNVEKFQTFWDKFQALVHRRTDLEKVVKMTYLLDCLKGPALATVAGFNEAEEDYDDAINALLNKYADRDKTRQTLVLQLFNLKKPNNNLKELEYFKSEYERILKSLRHYVTNLNASNWLIAIILQNKLPADADRAIYQRYNSKYFTIEQISGGLTDHIDYLTKVEKSVEFVSLSKFQQSVPNNQIGSYVLGTNKSKLQSNQCLLCDNQGHRAKTCNYFPDIKSRKNKLMELGKCSWCLREHKGKCNFNIKCVICGKSNHNEIFCFRNFKNNENESNKGKNTSAVIACSTTNISRLSTALPTAIVNIFDNSNNLVSTRCLFDSGSQMSFITSNLVNKLHLKIINTISLKIQGFRSQATTENYPIVNVVVALGNRKKRVKLAVVDHLPSNFSTPGLKKTCNFLKNDKLKLSDNFVSDAVNNIEVLIGSEYFSKFVGNLTVYKDVNLFESPGGLIIFGEIPRKFYNSYEVNEPSALICRITASYTPDKVSELIDEYTEPISKLWDLEVLGIKNNEINIEDKIAYNSYLNTVEFHDNKYWVRLPFKPNSPELPINYSQSLGQLYSLRSSLSKNLSHLKCYHNIIQEQVSRKFIEIVPNAKVSHGTHYLPHHGVAKDSVTTPLRIVFNCSFRSNKNVPSLNDTLMKGPSMTEKLCNMLLKFRLNKFAYVADIEKAFLNIGLQPQDRDKVRFLWFENPSDPNSQVITYRFSSVLFGATSSPFLLQATLDFHLRRLKSRYKDKLLNSFYVDNYIGNTNDERELLDIYDEANKHLSSANMPLRMWASNNVKLQNKIHKDYDGYTIPHSTSVLGLNWHLKTDSLSLKPVKLIIPQILTKRKLLGLVSTNFDPLGLVIPVLIKGKLLVQTAWRSNVSWNDPLPVCFLDQWKILQQEFLLLADIKIKRFVASQDCEYILHVFCDSSEKAYGCAIYLVCYNSSNLLMAKARVAPLKTKTLPQLELTALWLGVKLAKHVLVILNDIKISDVVIWSDNEACLQWVKYNRSNITYVKNRVAEIKEIASKFKFYHVLGEQNPSDLLTRGMNYKDFINSKLWFYGPE